MKYYYKLRVLGDEDLLIDGYLLYYEKFYFRQNTKPEKVIKVLEALLPKLSPIKGKEYAFAELTKYIKKFISKLKKAKRLPDDYREGGNREVSFEIHFYPEEQDYS